MLETGMTRQILLIRVYYEDTDSGGVVYYANYLKYAERGRTEWLRAIGLSNSALRESCGILIVVRTLEVTYKKPARLDDSLEVETVLTDLGGSSLTMQQIVRRPGEQGAEEICTLSVRLVCVSEATGRPTRWPEAVQRAMAGSGPGITDNGRTKEGRS